MLYEQKKETEPYIDKSTVYNRDFSSTNVLHIYSLCTHCLLEIHGRQPR